MAYVTVLKMLKVTGVQLIVPFCTVRQYLQRTEHLEFLYHSPCQKGAVITESRPVSSPACVRMPAAGQFDITIHTVTSCSGIPSHLRSLAWRCSPHDTHSCGGPAPGPPMKSGSLGPRVHPGDLAGATLSSGKRQSACATDPSSSPQMIAALIRVRMSAH